MENDEKQTTWLDDLLDKAEGVVDGMEKAARRMEGVWYVDEIIDGENGERCWNVSDDGRQKIHVYSSELAYRVCDLLNK